MLRINSLNELKYMIKEEEFSNMFPRGAKLPQVDVIRNTLKTIDIEGLLKINSSIIKKAIKNKTYDYGTIDGYTVAAIDGTKIFGSYKKCCDKCLITKIRGKEHYSHSCTVMSLVGDTPNLVIDYEMYRPKSKSSDKNEGELTVAKRLLNRGIKTYKSLIDIVTYDALACNPKFINECINLGVGAVIRVKKNYNLSLKDVKRKTNKKECVATWEESNATIEVYESRFYMTGVEQPLRYIKYTTKKKINERSQILIVTTCLDLELKTLYKIIKARWDIENSVFNNLKNGASMSHCFVHGGNAVQAILYLIFISSNLFQLFKIRRLKNHIVIQKELVRLLLKGLYLLKYNDVLIFSSA